MKTTFSVLLCLSFCCLGFSQKLLIELNEKGGAPSLINKGTYKVILYNDTDQAINLFSSHHKEYGGAVVTWSTTFNGTETSSGNKYKPMDTNSRFDKRAFSTVPPGQKKHIATLSLEPDKAGTYTKTYTMSQDPATVDMRYAANGTAKTLASQISAFDIAASIDIVVEDMETKALVAKDITFEELSKKKTHKDFTEAKFNPSEVFSMSLEFKDAAEAKSQLAEVAKLQNIRKLILNFKSAEAIDIPEALGAIPLMYLQINGRQTQLNIPANFLQVGSLRYLSMGKVRCSSLDFVGQQKDLENLTLYDCDLKAIPTWIGQLSKLEELMITDSPFTTIPEEFAALKNLKRLNLQKNGLTSVDHIYNNSGLTSLTLLQNNLSALPEEIGQLTALTKLDLRKNKLTNLPASIGNLKKLNRLDLTENNIQDLPDSFGGLSALKTLFLRKNGMTELPLALTKAASVKELYLDDNKLTSFPAEISNMKSLSHFNFENNQITAFPDSLFGMKKLFRIFTEGNPLSKKQKKKLNKAFGKRVRS